MFIPNCKTELVLTEDWTFELYYESRNDALLKCFGFYPLDQERGGGWWRYVQDGSRYPRTLRKATVTLLAGTIMRVDRVYIRQGTTDTYDSLTFWIKKRSKKQTINGRFWAKLADVNRMVCDVYLGEGTEDLKPQERASRIALLFED